MSVTPQPDAYDTGPHERGPVIEVDIHPPHAHGLKHIELGATPALAVVASRLVIPGGDCCYLYGWAICETTGGASAAIRLWDGNNTGTEVLARLNLASGESVRDQFVPDGIRCNTGRVFLEVIAGSVEGVLYYR